jgi:hypothetical protein
MAPAATAAPTYGWTIIPRLTPQELVAWPLQSDVRRVDKMEINITKFFQHCQHAAMDYSASVAEIGSDAGACTWRAACEDAPDYNLLDTEDKRDAFRTYTKTFGAWSDEEISAWSEVELNALFMQMIAGDMRESTYLEETPVDWAAYDADDNAVHNIFKGTDGEIYYYVGS